MTSKRTLLHDSVARRSKQRVQLAVCLTMGIIGVLILLDACKLSDARATSNLDEGKDGPGHHHHVHVHRGCVLPETTKKPMPMPMPMPMSTSTSTSTRRPTTKKPEDDEECDEDDEDCDNEDDDDDEPEMTTKKPTTTTKKPAKRSTTERKWPIGKKKASSRSGLVEVDADSGSGSHTKVKTGGTTIETDTGSSKDATTTTSKPADKKAQKDTELPSVTVSKSGQSDETISVKSD